MQLSHTVRCALPVTLMLFVAVSANAQDPDYVYTVTTEEALPGDDVILMVQLDNTGIAIQGWAYGVCHNASEVTLLDAVQGSTTMTVKNGAPPDFHAINILPGEGLTVGCAICFTGCAVLPPGMGYELLDITYNVDAGLDCEEPFLSEVAICDVFGMPSVVVLETGASVTPETVPGGIICSPPSFKRGDTNADGTFNGIVDGLFLLTYQFIPGSPQPPCMDAADVDDDGNVQGLIDALYLLNYQFIPGSPAPPPPFAECDTDPTDDNLSCGDYPCP